MERAVLADQFNLMGITKKQLTEMPEHEFREKLKFLLDSGVLSREEAQHWQINSPQKSAAPEPELKPMKKGLLDEEESGDEWVGLDDEDEQEEPCKATMVSTEAAPKAKKIVTVRSSKSLYWDMAQETATVMNISPGLAAVLLIKYRWKKQRLLDDFVTNNEKPFQYCRLPPCLSKETLVLEESPAGTCEICFCEAEKLYGMGCGHKFCMECWRLYVADRVRAQTQVINCMMDQCPYPLSPLEVERVVPDIGEAYGKVLSDADVEMSGVKVQCIRPNCPFILTLESLGPCNVATCKCGMRMCWLCRQEAHAPLPCSDLQRWGKVANVGRIDALNFLWEEENTKPCPSCHKNIEKNGGCNHMTCPCGYEFCWICGNTWRSKACGGYECTAKGWVDRYVETVVSDERTDKDAAMLVYRYDANLKSQTIEKQQREKVFKHLRNRLSRAGVMTCDEAVKQANHILEVIATARSVLMWSYAYC